MGATRLSCMIMFILAGASFLSSCMAFTGIPKALAAWVAALDPNPYALIAILALIYIVLGTALDGISMIVLTTSIVIPMVTAAGFDLVWFGIFIVLLVEIAELTPPLGFNLFVLQTMSGRDSNYVAWASLPFFGLMVLAIALITAFPGHRDLAAGSGHAAVGSENHHPLPPPVHRDRRLLDPDAGRRAARREAVAARHRRRRSACRRSSRCCRTASATSTRRATRCITAISPATATRACAIDIRGSGDSDGHQGVFAIQQDQEDSLRGAEVDRRAAVERRAGRHVRHLVGRFPGRYRPLTARRRS